MRVAFYTSFHGDFSIVEIVFRSSDNKPIRVMQAFEAREDYPGAVEAKLPSLIRRARGEFAAAAERRAREEELQQREIERQEREQQQKDEAAVEAFRHFNL